MMQRPPGVVRADSLAKEARPRFRHAAGVRSRVQRLGDAAGLSRMGVALREVPPGFAGTHRHFHEVEEEWALVLAGAGVLRLGPLRVPVGAGSFAGFAPGPCPHHFVNEGEAPLVLLEGGERRPAEDSGWYVDLGVAWRGGRFVPDAGTPPDERGDARPCVHVEALAEECFQHQVEPRARRRYRSLHRATGLLRQAVRWTRVAAGDRTTALHTHLHTDEWVYVISGRARLWVGSASGEVGPGDFVGHPAGGPPHAMEARTELVYVMGGQIDPDDEVLYPAAGLRRRHGRLERLPPEQGHEEAGEDQTQIPR